MLIYFRALRWAGNIGGREEWEKMKLLGAVRSLRPNETIFEVRDFGDYEGSEEGFAKVCAKEMRDANGGCT